MIANLYRYHNSPEDLVGFDEIIQQHPVVAYEIAVDRGYASEGLEEAIATDAELSYYYAVDLLGGERFPLGEPAIATDQHWSFLYTQLIGDKFELGEPAIAKNPLYSYRYAREALLPRGIKGFPLGEEMIATNAEYSFRYASEVLEKRFRLGEPAIRGSEYQSKYEQLFGVKL